MCLTENAMPCVGNPPGRLVWTNPRYAARDLVIKQQWIGCASHLTLKEGVANAHGQAVQFDASRIGPALIAAERETFAVAPWRYCDEPAA